MHERVQTHFVITHQYLDNHRRYAESARSIVAGNIDERTCL